MGEPREVDHTVLPTADLWTALSHINEWVRFADTKAAGTLAADGLIGGAMLSYFAGPGGGYRSVPVAILAALTGALTLASALCCLLCLIPRLRSGRPSRLLYFQGVAAFPTADDYRRAVEAALREGGLLGELVDELWSRSRAASLKYRYATYGIVLLAGGLVATSLLGVVVVLR
jgi:hypothetical protein